jgi:hypothetical protein
MHIFPRLKLRTFSRHYSLSSNESAVETVNYYMRGANSVCTLIDETKIFRSCNSSSEEWCEGARGIGIDTTNYVKV